MFNLLNLCMLLIREEISLSEFLLNVQGKIQ